MNKRNSGILLHITSLPSPHGIGDLGPGAYAFADFLAETKQHLWQILPLNPIDPALGSSPYHSSSAFAANTLLISPELLVRENLLPPDALNPVTARPPDKVDYPAVAHYKKALLDQAFNTFQTKDQSGFRQFCASASFWLDDFALFTALKAHFQGQVWSEWPTEFRDRGCETLAAARNSLDLEIEKLKFGQWLFYKQWGDLKNYCHGKGIQLIGDMPIYLIHDSADIWLHPDLVKLDPSKRPYAVAGVPPDYFSATGQFWGNPVYDWEQMAKNRYTWWLQRIKHNLGLFDLVRIDHFRGLVAYWEIPAHEKTAIQGRWVQAPVKDFLETVLKEIPPQALIAEDLGYITQDVKEVMQCFDLPGMKILLFAFGPDLATNPYIPHQHIPHCIVYTGTHDNNTIRGWFENELNAEGRERVFKYLGRVVPARDIHLELIRLAMMSVAERVIFPMQDLLGLGQEARMNKPSFKDHNWQWRLSPELITPALKQNLREMTELYGRGAWPG